MVKTMSQSFPAVFNPVAKRPASEELNAVPDFKRTETSHNMLMELDVSPRDKVWRVPFPEKVY